jgi:hypothetical protein
MNKHKWDTIDGESWRITVGNMQGRVWISGAEYYAAIYFFERGNHKEQLGNFVKLEQAKRACQEWIMMVLPTEDPDNDTA